MFSGAFLTYASVSPLKRRGIAGFDSDTSATRKGVAPEPLRLRACVIRIAAQSSSFLRGPCQYSHLPGIGHCPHIIEFGYVLTFETLARLGRPARKNARSRIHKERVYGAITSLSMEHSA